MRQREPVDLSLYAKALSVLARNPIIIVFPLLAAVCEIALAFLRGPLFDPLGGNDFGLFGLLFNLIDGFAFALAIIAAETAWRNSKPSFSSAWEEGKRKAGGILLATVGFFFMVFVAAMFGNYLGALIGTVLQVVALFFLIYTIPAAAIGAIPGGAALSASIERVRGNYAAAAVLTIVAILLYVLLVSIAGSYLALVFGAYTSYVMIVVKAVIIGYLACVFARQYDEVGFFRPY